MVLALFVPPAAAIAIERLVRDQEVLVARCWRELDSFISENPVTAAIIDPCADGRMDVPRVLQIMASRPSLPVFAYVPPTALHLKAIFQLSKHGLKDVFVHPLMKLDLRFSNAVKGVSADWLAFDFLGRLETRLGRVSPALFRAIKDIFERPHCYQHAGDLATQAGVSVRNLYRRFDAARIGTPTKLITAAKVLRGYHTLRASETPLGRVSRAIGFSDYKQFSDRTTTIFGCTPKRLRDEPKL